LRTVLAVNTDNCN